MLCSLALGLLPIIFASASTFAQSTNNDAVRVEAFLAQAESELAALSVMQGRAEWVNSTYLTDDTDALAAEFGARRTELSVRLAKRAAKFDGAAGLSFDARRKLHFLKQGIVLPAPDKPGAADELNVIATRLQSQYGKGKGTLDGKPINGSDIEEAMGTGARARPAEGDVAELARQRRRADARGLRALGHDRQRRRKGTGLSQMWAPCGGPAMTCPTRNLPGRWTGCGSRSSRSMTSSTATCGPSSTSITAPKVQPATGPIRADLLGNMWAQEWGNIYDLGGAARDRRCRL